MSIEYSELNQPSIAQNVYNKLCKMLDGIKWKYNRDDKNYVVTTSAVGNDLTINLRIVVSEERQIMYIKSVLPYDVPEARREIVGRALHIANFSILNGCFEYNQSNGNICFKMVAPFFDCELSEKICHYLVMLTCQMVDKFNDKILDLMNGKMTLMEFKLFAEK